MTTTDRSVPERDGTGGNGGTGGRETRWPLWAFGLLLVAAGLHGLRPLWSNDIFWHLASGRLILATHSLPARDPFTYTAIHRWIHQEWLSEVLLAAAARWLGLAGLRLVRALFVVGGLLILWRLMRGAGAPAKIAAALAAWEGLLPNASLRPHLLVWPLAIALVAGAAPHAIAACEGREARSRCIAWMTALFLGEVLWVNLHASAVILPLLLVVEAAGGGIDRLLGFHDRVGRGAWVAALVSTVACVLQPAGALLLRYVLETPRIDALSIEWRPLLELDTLRTFPSAALVWLVLLVAVVGVGFAEHRRRGVDATFPGFWSAMACLAMAAEHRRMVIFFFIPAIWVAPRLLAAWMTLSRDLRRAIAAIVVASLGVMVAIELPSAAVGSPLRAGVYPEQATRFLEATAMDGRIFNDLAWGGYLEFYRYPEQQVFGDGRWLLGGLPMLRDYRVMYGHEGPLDRVEALYARWKVSLVVAPSAALARLAGLDPRIWRLAWIDPTATVLLRVDDGFPERRRRVCDFYATHAALSYHAVWPAEITRRNRRLAAIPSLLRECVASGR